MKNIFIIVLVVISIGQYIDRRMLQEWVDYYRNQSDKNWQSYLKVADKLIKKNRKKAS